MDIDKATETELRRFLNANGVMDFEFITNVHPRSKELRDGGFPEQADMLDDYYQKVSLGRIGHHRVWTFDEVKAKAKALKERMDAQ